MRVLLLNKADPNLQDKVTSRGMMIMIVDGDDDDINCGDMIDDADSDADL